MSESVPDSVVELRPPLRAQQAAEDTQPPPSLKDRVLQSLSVLNKRPLAVLIVGLPLALILLYEGFIATDIYVSEAHFIVRSKAMSGSLNGLSETSSLQPLSSMSQSNDYTQAVNDYLASRDLIKVLVEKDRFLEVTSRSEADFIARHPRFWSEHSTETLYRRLDDFIYPYFDSSKGISTLYVYAFRPEDAKRIAQAALDHAEALINRLNDRQQKDSLSFSQDMLEKARKKVWEAEQNIADFRNRQSIFDPIRQGAAAIDLISRMNGDIAQLKSELSEVNVISPGSPKITSIKARIAAIEQQINEQRALIAGGDQSLAPKLAAYEKLLLERDLAVKTFSSALLLLEGAVRDVDMQRLYLDKVVEPNLPDYARYPRRLLVIAAIFGFSLCIYWIVKVLGEVILEHEQ